MVKTPFRPMEQIELGHQWAEPDVDRGAALMRHVFENRDECRAKAHCLAEHLCATYEADRVAAGMYETLLKHF